MPKFDSKAENVVTQLLDGDYRFEIVAVDSGISTGPKTRGSETRDVKLKFYADAEFTKPLAQWTEDFINADNCVWKWSVFAKCVGMEFGEGEEFDITDRWIGRRGWATCKPQTSTTDKDKKYNRVAVFIVNKQRIPPAVRNESSEDREPLPF